MLGISLFGPDEIENPVIPWAAAGDDGCPGGRREGVRRRPQVRAGGALGELAKKGHHALLHQGVEKAEGRPVQAN